MNAQRWQRITEAFDIALERPAEQRDRYLHETYSDDPEIRAEVARLLAEFDKAGNFLENPPIAPVQACNIGDLIANRYRIEALIGRGGMGEVYCAYDEMLREPVALKTLRSEFTGNTVILHRFQREVQLARRVTHANVCRVFDVGVHLDSSGRPLHFFTMQLLEGETLAARVRRGGRLSKDEAFPIIKQMAEGLHAAHQAGIIHRDFKSSNIMLTGDAAKPTAVITDFGLARFDAARATAEPAGTLTTTTQIAGTIAYMSPEQLSGGEITPASDIYSLGIVLFEMATGQLPFNDTHIIQSAMQRASDSVVDVRTLAPKIDPHWASAITRCLRRESEKRFPNALDIAAGFKVRRWPYPPSWSRLQWMKVAVAMTVISIVLVALSVLIPRLRYRDVQAGAKIMLAPTDNATGELRFNAVSTALRTTVGQSSRFNLWDNSRLDDALRSMRREPGSKLSNKDWREIAFREGSPLVILSTLSSVGDGYHLAIHAEQIGAAPDTPMRTWDQAFSVPSPGAVFDAIHAASSWVRTTAGETATELSAHNRLPQNITSSSWEALELYERAEALSRKDRAADAIPLLRRAIDLDPAFAIAHLRLGDILNAQRRGDEGFLYWEKALEAGRRQRLSDREQLVLESRYPMELGDYSKAEPALREWVNRFPNDPRAPEWLAACLLSLGKFPEGVEVARRAREHFGSTLFGTAQIIHGSAMQGKLDLPSELEILAKIPAPAWRLRFEGALAAARGDYKVAESAFQRLWNSTQGQERSRSTFLLAMLAADQGDLRRAVGILQDGIAEDRGLGENGLAAQKASNVAFLEYLNHKMPSSRSWALQAVSLSASPTILMQSATILARQGFLIDAERLANQMPVSVGPSHRANLLQIKAELLIAKGHHAQALSFLQTSSKSESQLLPREYLARAYWASQDFERAEQEYSAIARTPWLAWISPEIEWPGLRFAAEEALKKIRGDRNGPKKPHSIH